MKPVFKKCLLLLLALSLVKSVFSQAPNITYASSNLTAGVQVTISPVNTGGAVPVATYGQVTTFAGSPAETAGYVNAGGTAAQFNWPQQMTQDALGNLYVADATNNAIRMISPAGVVSTFAGSLTGASGLADSTGTAALFNYPDGITTDGSGNLFVSDYNNNAIREITPAGVVSTFYSSANTFGPGGLCFDLSGNLIVAAQDAGQIISISPAGVASVLAGSTPGYVNGTGAAAQFNTPTDVKADAAGNIYVVDFNNNAIRKIDASGVVTTLAGSALNGNTPGYADGVGTAAVFNNPVGMAVGAGGVIYVSDMYNNDIRRIMPDGTVSSVAGSTAQAPGDADGIGTAAGFNQPDYMYIDHTGTAYVAEFAANRIRKITLTGYTLRGTLPAGLTFDPTTGTISGTPRGVIAARTDTVVAYNASGYSVATVTFSTGQDQSPSVTYASSNLTVGVPVMISPVNTGGAVPASTYGQVTTFAGSPAETAGYVNGSGTAAQFNWPQQMTQDALGNIYVADATNNAIRMISPSGAVTTFAGSPTGVAGLADSTGTAALFSYPDGIAMDGSGNLFVSDYNNNAIRKITPAGVVSTFYSSANTFGPGGLCFDVSGNLIVAAQDASQIVSITPAGVASVIAGSTPGYVNDTGAAAQFNTPTDVKADAAGNIYVVDFNNNAIRKINPAGVVTTLAGSAVSGNTPGYADGVGTAAVFNNPVGMAIGPGGVIYVTDMYNNDILRIMPDGTVSLVAGSAAQVPGDADGTGTTAGFSQPDYLYVDNTGTAYVAEFAANRIRKITLTGYTLTGTLPAGLTFNPTTGTITGTPTAVTASTSFTVSAFNEFGVSTTTMSIAANAGSNTGTDDDKNWIYIRNYDENGAEIAASKTFFDNNAKQTQKQVKNETAGNVLASQTLYDIEGRAVVTTLTAPINSADFAYNANFITNNGNPYSYLNFDGDPTNTAAPHAKLNNADAVDNTLTGTLGWYYSNNNTAEPYVAATSYPYRSSDFYRDGTGGAKRKAGVGESLKMGGGHETFSNGFPVQNELNNYLAIRNQFFPAAVVGANPSSMAGQALQSITTDENGHSVLSITDLSGKMTLVSGRADPAGWLFAQNTLSLSAVKGQYMFNIHIDGPASVQGDPSDPQINAMLHQLIMGFGITSINPVTVTCTNSGLAPWTGTGNSYVPPFPPLAGSYDFTITSDYPFTVAASNSYGAVYDQAEAPFAEPAGTSIQYFQLAAPSAVSLTGSWALYDMYAETGSPLSFTSGSTLPAGYYKVVALQPTDNSTNTVTVNFTNRYTDVTYNYYNSMGQLIAKITPNGTSQIAVNGITSYASVDKLPYVSLFTYDLQQHLVSRTTPDRGTTNYIYRQDGQIRFSQNAFQANAANAGQGNVEKFSYTIYDNMDRPIETGEYAVPTATFAGLATNTTAIETTDPAGGLTGGTKLSQVNTYYDLPDPNFSLSGYVQDPGFLKGAVSYGTNANGTTWYNYDDHGRMTWVVKLINGLTSGGQPSYKTMDYTYDDRGKLIKSDYQKGTPSERFIHYYTYDTDGKLINVQTSRDDITKIQQANYTYYLHGPLKREELGDHLQGLDYVYTAQGWLKSVNTPTQVAANDPGGDGVSNSFAKDAFGMQLEYFPGDYVRSGANISSIATGQPFYNGRVTGISWQSNKPSSVLAGSPAIQNPAMYSYTYDPKYQLSGAVWGTPTYTGTAAFSAGNTFTENNITYDQNGNIQGVKRTDVAGATLDDFTNAYTYQTGTNQVTKVHDVTKGSDYANYTYNEIGQMSSAVFNASPGVNYYLKYDVFGKITGIYSDQTMNTPLETYSYDENGNRIATVNSNGTTYYVYDPTGNIIAIYSGTAISEAPVYGNSRLGSYFFAADNYQYELRDNVGSVRVVMNRTKNSSGQADIVRYNDYYPYGSIAQSGGEDYRYDYQGAFAQKDQVTGWNNFNLRMYDGKIGRWLTVDPKGQFASPYLGMGNNPTNGTDPDGGFWQEFMNFITGHGWMSNAERNFITAYDKAHTKPDDPQLTVNPWSGSRLTGYGSVDYGGNGGVISRRFGAVQDYTYKGVDYYFDFTAQLTFGLRSSAEIKGWGFGYDINIFSLNVASYSWAKDQYEAPWLGQLEVTSGASVTIDDIEAGIEGKLKWGKDGKLESASLSSDLAVGLLHFKAEHDYIEKTLANELSIEGSVGTGFVLTGALKLVAETHKSAHE